MLQFTGILVGLTNIGNSIALFGFIFAGQGIILVAFRTGLNRRFQDPSLTLPQTVFAIATIGLAYIINPPARSMTAIIMALVLVYCAFILNPAVTLPS